MPEFEGDWKAEVLEMALEPGGDVTHTTTLK